ncbi:MAG: CidA/LrgA family protein [Brachymonas sp.]
MQALTGFAVLLLAQSLGEVMARWVNAKLGLALPGPVWGMLLLGLALLAPWVQRRLAAGVGEASRVLLTHLSLLFVPVGVGVMVHLGLLSAYGWKLLAVLVLSTWLGLVVTALVLKLFWPQPDADVAVAAGTPNQADLS